MSNIFNQLPNQTPLVQAIHTAVKGRARYKVSGLYRSVALKKYLEFRLSQQEGITQVRANNLTGNVLVISRSDFSLNALTNLLQSIVLDYKKQARLSPIRTSALNTAPRAIAQKQKISSTTSALSTAPRAIAQKQKTSPGQILEKDVVTTASQLILGASAACTLFLCTGLLHQYGLDEGILLLIQKLHTPILDRIMLGVTFFGEPQVLLSVCLGAQIGLLVNNRRTQATALGITAVGAIGLNYWLKMLFARTRPALWEWIVDVNHYSFPSGHAMMSMITYGFIGYVLAKQFPRWQRQIFALTFGLIVAIGFSRLYLGVHWATDVVAGYAVGIVWLIVCVLGRELWQKYCLSKASSFSAIKAEMP